MLLFLEHNLTKCVSFFWFLHNRIIKEHLSQIARTQCSTEHMDLTYLTPYFFHMSAFPFKRQSRTSLVAQWLRICLPMQGTRVWALVWEDPTCRGATGPVHHNYWACTLEPASHNYWAHVPQLLSLHSRARAPQQRRATTMRSPRTTMKSSPHSPQLEKALAQKRRPNTAIN